MIKRLKNRLYIFAICIKRLQIYRKLWRYFEFLRPEVETNAEREEHEFGPVWFELWLREMSRKGTELDPSTLQKFLEIPRHRLGFSLHFDRYKEFLPQIEWIFPDAKIVDTAKPEVWHEATGILIWGLKFHLTSYRLIARNKSVGLPVLIAEDGFLKSVHTGAALDQDIRLRTGVSVVLDDMTAYYDSTLPSRIETWLNSDEIIPDEEIREAKQHIEFIVKNHLTKYNHQPIYEPELGCSGRKKVLLVDQRRSDFSIIRGCADPNTFEAMLKCAIRENPDADILVKTHPDTLAGMEGYYTKVKKSGNIIPITFGINPISLIKAVDHVYVVSSQFGFEAAMCGKKVTVFGLPFYSGWGVTDDRLPCLRRRKKRTLEEIFVFAYMRYTHYADPDTQKPCDMQRAMEWLLENRRVYFKAANVRCDI